MNIHLVLKGKWYDLIDGGDKTIEYRAFTKYWDVRIGKKKKEITTVTFSRGYKKAGMKFWVDKITVGPCPYEGFDGMYYRIHLGERMHITQQEEK